MEGQLQFTRTLPHFNLTWLLALKPSSFLVPCALCLVPCSLCLRMLSLSHWHSDHSYPHSSHTYSTTDSAPKAYAKHFLLQHTHVIHMVTIQIVRFHHVL